MSDKNRDIVGRIKREAERGKDLTQSTLAGFNVLFHKTFSFTIDIVSRWSCVHGPRNQLSAP